MLRLNCPCAHRSIATLEAVCDPCRLLVQISTGSAYSCSLTRRLSDTLLHDTLPSIESFKHTLLCDIVNMFCCVIFFLIGIFALSAVSTHHPDQIGKLHQTTVLTDHILVSIAPTTASCTGAEFSEECADAKQAVKAINQSFETYKISFEERASLVAYMLFESGNFKYNRNHYPGRPGQGTRMMAMPSYVKLYATSVAGADAVAMAEATGGDASLSAVLKLVNCDDEKSFGSAAWFLSTQCSEEIRSGLSTRGIDGWHEFLVVCVGTTVAAERDMIWVAITQVMNGFIS
jgi:hypothetical protein